MTPDKAPRRWWLTDNTDNSGWSVDTEYDHNSMFGSCNVFEVIEANAYDAIEAELQRERRKVEKYNEILNWFQINAFNKLDKMQADEFRKELQAIDEGR